MDDMSISLRVLGQTPSWPEYLREVARRSRAGFASIHNELLQRYRERSMRASSNRSIMSKHSLISEKKTSRLFGYRTSIKGHTETSRETFVSYVDENREDSDQMKADTESDDRPGVIVVKSKTGTVLVNEINGSTATAIGSQVPAKTQSEDGSESVMRDHCITANQKHEAQSNKTSKNPYVNQPEEAVYKVPVTATYDEGNNANFDEPIYIDLDSCFEIERIYEIPVTPNNSENTVADTGSFQTTQLEEKANESLNECIIYTDQEQIANVDEKYESDNGYTSIELLFVSETTNSESKSLHSSRDYNNTDKLNQNTGQRSATLPIDAVKHKTTVQRAATLPYQSAKSAPMPKSQGQHNGTTTKPDANTDNTNSDDDFIMPDHHDVTVDSDNVYVLADTVATLSRTPKSATVTPYIPHTGTRISTVRPRTRPFLLYTVEEVVECFNECALPHLANICKEENLDGEYIRELNDEELSHEPFCLRHFHISKVRRIIEGWRPKRQTSYQTQ